VFYATGILGELVSYDYADPATPLRRGLVQQAALKQGRTLAWVAARGSSAPPALLMSTRDFLLYNVSSGGEFRLIANASAPRLPVAGHNDDGINGLAVVRGVAPPYSATTAHVGERSPGEHGASGSDLGCMVVGAGMAGNLPAANISATREAATTIK